MSIKNPSIENPSTINPPAKRPSSEKRILASRANGALARGRKTAEGKRRSAMNALRHGLLSKHIVLKNEADENFAIILKEHLQKFAPADGVELGCIEEMAASIWRLRRVWAIETNLLNQAVEKRDDEDELARLAGAFQDLARGGPELNLLGRYESRIHRIYQRSLFNFLDLRDMKRDAATRRNAPDDAGCDAD